VCLACFKELEENDHVQCAKGWDKREVAFQAQIGPQKDDEHAITEVKISIKHVSLKKTSHAYTYTHASQIYFSLQGVQLENQHMLNVPSFS